MCLGESGVAFELRNELVIGMRLLPREINVEDEQWNQAHDRNVVGGRAYLPQLSPVHKVPLQRRSLLRLSLVSHVTEHECRDVASNISTISLTRGFRPSSWLVGFFGQHYWRRA